MSYSKIDTHVRFSASSHRSKNLLPMPQLVILGEAHIHCKGLEALGDCGQQSNKLRCCQSVLYVLSTRTFPAQHNITCRAFSSKTMTMGGGGRREAERDGWAESQY